MKLSISNIGWSVERDEQVYMIMHELGFEGLEIAPTRLFAENPYQHIPEAKKWAQDIKGKYGYVVSSMQSIWYGRQEKIYGSEEERRFLTEYTREAIDFAEAIECKNLVFGCPRNRCVPEDYDSLVGINFFKEIGDYAAEHNTVIGIEANPPIYNTNYINDTVSALDLIKAIDSDGIKLNLDIGTMVENGEIIDLLIGKEYLINHVHVSEPGLNQLKNRNIHFELANLLKNVNYNGFISIEVCKQDNVVEIKEMMSYVKRIFGE